MLASSVAAISCMNNGIHKNNELIFSNSRNRFNSFFCLILKKWQQKMDHYSKQCLHIIPIFFFKIRSFVVIYISNLLYSSCNVFSRFDQVALQYRQLIPARVDRTSASVCFYKLPWMTCYKNTPSTSMTHVAWNQSYVQL